MTLAFLAYAFGVVNVQINSESGRILGRPLSANYPFMRLLIHHSRDRDADAAKPRTQIT
jgi:hypothetical protein